MYYDELFDRHVPWAGQALCWAVVQPVAGAATVEEVATAMSGEPVSLRRAKPDDGKVALVQVEDSVLLLEVNGYELSRPETLRVLSGPGRAQAAYWNVNGGAQITCAYYGTVVAQWSDGELDGSLGQPQLLSALAAHAGWENGTVRQTLVSTELERLSGIRLQAEYLTKPQLVLSPPTVTPDPVWPNSFAGVDAELEFLLRQANPAERERTIADLVRRSIEASDIDDPDVAEAIEVLSLPSAQRPPLTDNLLLVDLRGSAQLRVQGSRKGSAQWKAAQQQYQALWALVISLTNDATQDPLNASALTHAWGALRDEWETARRPLIDRLRQQR